MLESASQSPGLKRSSLGSAEDGYDMHKRPSDAMSITDSRDYTFEESEDSIPHREIKQELETKAKAILGKYSDNDNKEANR